MIRSRGNKTAIELFLAGGKVFENAGYAASLMLKSYNGRETASVLLGTVMDFRIRACFHTFGDSSGKPIRRI